MNLMQLAQRIRDARQRRDMTLEQLASEAGLTRSFLSRVENFRATPSLPALVQIARSLGVTVAELVEGLDDRPSVVVIRSDERQRFERDRPHSKIEYYALAAKRPAKNMEPFLLVVPPGIARSQKHAHEPEEFLMVLEGKLDCEYGDQTYRLEEGDCLYADWRDESTLAAVGRDTKVRLYRRQDEAGTPYCITVDGDTLTDNTVTIRDRDSLEQWRVTLDEVVEEIRSRVE